MELKYINLPVISYCEIPDEIKETGIFEEASCDNYIKYNITKKEEQVKYDDDFAFDNWVIENYPELEGEDIMVHIDY